MVVYPFDPTELLPAEAGEPRLREAHFTTRDRETLVIWVAPAAPGQLTILYFPGNAGTLADRVPRFFGFLNRL